MSEYYQVQYDTKGPEALQWERMNFILKRIFDTLNKSDLGSTDVSAEITDLQNQINALAKQISSLSITVITGGGGSSTPGVVNTTAPLTGGGTLPITIAIPQATSSVDGYLAAVDWVIFNDKLSNPFIAQGDILYANGSFDPVRLAIGTANQVLHGGATAPSYSPVVEADISLSNIATNNVTSARHGFTPILPNDPSKFFDGQGNYSTIPASVAVNSYKSVSFSSQTSVTVTHNFGAYPAVQVIDNSGNIMEAKTVNHTSLNQFVVTFIVATTGTIIATLGSPQAQAVKVVTANYSILTSDRIIKVTTAGVTISLPAASGNTGFEFVVDNASPGTIFVDVTGGGTIEGETSQFLLLDSAIHCYCDGSNWRFY